MIEKYIIRDFHLRIFFYFLGLVFFVCTIALTVRAFIYLGTDGHLPPINTLAAMFSFMSSSLFTLFAMWFDMESNKHLKYVIPSTSRLTHRHKADVRFPG